MMDGGVSVVIPFYNSAKTLARALASVVAQTETVLEIVVVDDASNEEEYGNAVAIVAEVPGARVIRLERNAGPGHARNVGWEAARGSWVAFLDSDDAWHAHKIEFQLLCAREAVVPPALIATRTVRGRSLAELDHPEGPGGCSARRIRKSELLMRNRMSTTSVMVRRDLHQRFNPERRYAEDYELWLTIVGVHDNVMLVDAPLAMQFKAAYGVSGLSSRIWRMILGEYQAYLGARRAGAISTSDMFVGLSASTVRSCVRLARLGARALRRHG